LTLTASFISDFWNEQLVDHGKQGVFLVLVGFVGSFAFIRMSTRIQRSPRVKWWPGSVVSDSGVHVHHLVFGIFMMLGAATVGYAVLDHSPWMEITALLFGIGAGLTVDEFALWLHLDDVYWAEEGRGSVDATVIAAAGIALVLFGANPFAVEGANTVEVIVSAVAAVLLFLFVAICFMKQRLFHGVFGFFLFPLAAYGAARVGKPGSPWAKRFYGERNPDKQRKAETRFRPDRRSERVKDRFRDLVGGSTSAAYEASLTKPGAKSERDDG
jgi:hypothetical protein